MHHWMDMPPSSRISEFYWIGAVHTHRIRMSILHRYNLFRTALVLPLALVCCCRASAQEDATSVHNYTRLPGDEVSSRFQLTVDGVRVPCIRYEKGSNRYFAVARFASADATPTYTVTIDEAITDYRIHPTRYYPVDAVAIAGKSITFRLSAELRYMIVELNSAKPYLAIVNDPPEVAAQVPDVDAENVLSVKGFLKDATSETDVSQEIAAAIDELYRNDRYDTLFFPDGVYLYDGLELRGRSGKPVTIYLSEGALLKNRMQPAVDSFEPAVAIWDSSDITIAGRGMFDGNGYDSYDTTHGGWRHDAVSSHHQGGIMVLRSKNITFRDTYLRDAKQWNFETHTSKDVTFRNIKAFTPYRQPWIDGINLASGQNILVDGALTLGNDDCFASGHYNPNNKFRQAKDRLTWDTEDTRQIAVRNTLHWSCEAGNGIRLGADPMGHKLLAYVFENFNAVNFKGGDHGITFQNGIAHRRSYPHYDRLVFKNCSFDTSRVSKNMQIFGLDSNTRINAVQIVDCWFSNAAAGSNLQNIDNLTVTGLHVEGRRVKKLSAAVFQMTDVAQPKLDFDVRGDESFRFAGNYQSSYSVRANEEVAFTISAVSANGKSTLSVQLADQGTLPKGATFDHDTGIFNWNPTEQQTGTGTLSFTTTNGKRTLVQNITIHVAPAAEP